MSDFPAGVTLGLLPPREAERAEPRFVAAPITAQYAVAPEHFLMRVRDAAIARGGPGQFVMFNPTRRIDVHPLLPRPMAVYRYLPGSDEFEIVYRVIGTGTRVMSERRAGELAELVGPVGQCFQLLGDGDDGQRHEPAASDHATNGRRADENAGTSRGADDGAADGGGAP